MDSHKAILIDSEQARELAKELLSVAEDADQHKCQKTISPGCSLRVGMQVVVKPFVKEET